MSIISVVARSTSLKCEGLIGISMFLFICTIHFHPSAADGQFLKQVIKNRPCSVNQPILDYLNQAEAHRIPYRHMGSLESHFLVNYIFTRPTLRPCAPKINTMLYLYIYFKVVLAEALYQLLMTF